MSLSNPVTLSHKEAHAWLSEIEHIEKMLEDALFESK
jgi:hypothetical protein